MKGLSQSRDMKGLKSVSSVSAEFGTDILNSIVQNDLGKLREIFEKRLKTNERIRELCESNIKHKHNRTECCPLILAAKQPTSRILRYMLERGVNPNFVYTRQLANGRKESVTSLHISVDLSRYDVIETLLSFNCHCNIRDHNSQTPLLVAVQKADWIMAQMLLSKGADPNLRDRDGNTALHLATELGHTQLVRTLLTANADVNLKGGDNFIPIQIAAKEGHAHLLDLLCTAEGSTGINTLIQCANDQRAKALIHIVAAHAHDVTVVQLVDSLGADVTLQDSEWNTALHYVVLRPYNSRRMRERKYFTDTARALLERRANPNARNAYGDTPLHLAAMNQFPKIVEMMLQYGARSKAENTEHLKPIDIVPMWDHITRQLLENAMKKQRKDTKGVVSTDAEVDEIYTDENRSVNSKKTTPTERSTTGNPSEHLATTKDLRKAGVVNMFSQETPFYFALASSNCHANCRSKDFVFESQCLPLTAGLNVIDDQTISNQTRNKKVVIYDVTNAGEFSARIYRDEDRRNCQHCEWHNPSRSVEYLSTRMTTEKKDKYQPILRTDDVEPSPSGQIRREFGQQRQNEHTVFDNEHRCSSRNSYTLGTSCSQTIGNHSECETSSRGKKSNVHGATFGKHHRNDANHQSSRSLVAIKKEAKQEIDRNRNRNKSLPPELRKKKHSRSATDLHHYMHPDVRSHDRAEEYALRQRCRSERKAEGMCTIAGVTGNYESQTDDYLERNHDRRNETHTFNGKHDNDHVRNKCSSSTFSNDSGLTPDHMTCIRNRCRNQFDEFDKVSSVDFNSDTDVTLVSSGSSEIIKSKNVKEFPQMEKTVDYYFERRKGPTEGLNQPSNERANQLREKNKKIPPPIAPKPVIQKPHLQKSVATNKISSSFIVKGKMPVSPAKPASVENENVEFSDRRRQELELHEGHIHRDPNEVVKLSRPVDLTVYATSVPTNSIGIQCGDQHLTVIADPSTYQQQHKQKLKKKKKKKYQTPAVDACDITTDCNREKLSIAAMKESTTELNQRMYNRGDCDSDAGKCNNEGYVEKFEKFDKDYEHYMDDTFSAASSSEGIYALSAIQLEQAFMSQSSGRSRKNTTRYYYTDFN